MQREGEVFEESEGPIEDILGGGRIRFYIFVISSFELYLFIYLCGHAGKVRLRVRTGRRAARDGSLTARATGRLTHILFSLLAVRDSHHPMPHHSRNSSTITSISISVHIKSTHSLSIPAIFRFHFTSFGNTTYCIYPPYITAPPIPRNPNQAYPPGTPTFPKFGFATRPLLPRSAISLSTIVFAWLAERNMPACRHSLSEPYCLR